MAPLREVVAAARLDFGEVLRSRWLLFSTGAYVVLAGALVLAGLRESSVLGFTGMDRVLLSFAHALLVVLPLLALTATTQVVNRGREDGTIELLFSHPLSRESYFAAITLTRYAVLVGPLIALVVVLGVGARFAGEEVPWGMVLRASVVSAALLWAFTGLGLAVSTRTRNQARAVVLGLGLWAAGVAFLDLAVVGLLLEWRMNPQTIFVLSSLNPVQAARLALLAGIEPDLGTLGSVGFYLVHRLGTTWVQALGVLWPAALGTAAWLYARRSFRVGDLV